MSAALTLEESKSLLALCRAGRLYEIEDWIRAGRSIEVSEGVRQSPLQVAMDTDFKAWIELLIRNETQIKNKNKALGEAVERRRLHLVELLVEHGAEISFVPFADVLQNAAGIRRSSDSFWIGMLQCNHRSTVRRCVRRKSAILPSGVQGVPGEAPRAGW